jgi:uncharacterized membrane protein AbrB (regulator of aidB expression)
MIFNAKVIEALKTHWPVLLSVYLLVLLVTLYFGLRLQQKGIR